MAMRPARRISVQNGNDFQICASMEKARASVGSLSQFGPSMPVILKIRVLMTPHSGLSMKRIDKMVGMDGTAQGRMKMTDSALIHQRVFRKNPDRNSAIIILTFTA